MAEEKTLSKSVADYLQRGLRAVNTQLGIQQPWDRIVAEADKVGPAMRSLYKATYPALDWLYPGLDLPEPNQYTHTSDEFVGPPDPPEAEITETTDEEGKKKIVKKVKMGGAPKGKAAGAEKKDTSSMYSAMAAAFQTPPRPELGFSMADLDIPQPPDVVSMNKLAQQQHAPFLPAGQYQSKGGRIMGMLAHALTQTEQGRQSYYAALDRNYQRSHQQEMMAEQQKRLKMQAQLDEEETLVRLQKYKQQQQASDQLASMVMEHGPQIFMDQELNQGAQALMDMAGGHYGAMQIPRPQRPQRATSYELFWRDYKRRNPTASHIEGRKAYAQAGTRGTDRDKQVREMLVPKDPLARNVAKTAAASWVRDVTSDPEYRASEEASGINVDNLLSDIARIYGEREIMDIIRTLP